MEHIHSMMNIMRVIYVHIAIAMTGYVFHTELALIQALQLMLQMVKHQLLLHSILIILLSLTAIMEDSLVIQAQAARRLLLYIRNM